MCADTPYPDYCATVFSACPDRKAGDPRALAEIAVHAAAKTSAAAAALARTEEKGIKDGAWWCMDTCAANIEDAAARLVRRHWLRGLTRAWNDPAKDIARKISVVDAMQGQDAVNTGPVPSRKRCR